jgi:histidinol-phosphate phosphatase family protein
MITSHRALPVFDVVIPTIGRPSLGRLLLGLQRAATDGCTPQRVVVVDDRLVAREALRLPSLPALPVTVIRSGGAGPAAARNLGWRCGFSPWVVFLDDDVELPPSWTAELVRDLLDADGHPRVAAVSGRIHVPLPSDRPPTDRERDVAGLARALWATADNAYRRTVLAEIGGFDERFPRAYREDADIAIRTLRAGYELRRGERTLDHPVGDAPWHVSVRRQRGNRDDALLLHLHGRARCAEVGVITRRRPLHLATTATAAVAVAGSLSGNRRLAAVAGLGWATLVAEFAWRRIAPGFRHPREIAGMVATTLLIPPAATWAWLTGLARAWWIAPSAGPAARALLVDRDGTLVDDVPYNGDPEAVRPRPGVAEALDRARARGLAVAVVSNQSGIGRGIVSADAVDAVNRRVADLLGPFDAVLVCPHHPDAGCPCRKPEPGLVRQAADLLGVRPPSCVVIGDIGADVEAARRAGARGILVPTAITRVEEIEAAEEVASDFSGAVSWALGGRPAARARGPLAARRRPARPRRGSARPTARVPRTPAAHDARSRPSQRISAGRASGAPPPAPGA